MQSHAASQLEEVTPLFTNFIAGTSYHDLPQPITERVKKSILDTIGVIIPASELMPDLKKAMGIYIDAGGKPESTVLAYGVKLPAWAAAFANGVRGHSLDYADGHLEAVFRIGISCIPAALALAERRGVAIGGKELITAVAVAEEFLCRLGVSVARRRKSFGPWHCGILLGNFGATAASARMLNLTAEQTDRAFGVGFLQCGGTVGVTAPDANIRGMYAGFTSKNGVMAALMAEQGLLGPRGVLSSPDGLFDAYFQGAYDRDYLIADIGKEFELRNLSFKPWPACAFAHPFIDAMLTLRAEHSIRPEDIERIEVHSGEVTKEFCEPVNLAAGKYPKTTNNGKRSVPFNVALAALKGKISFSDFTPEALANPEVLRMAEKVQWVHSPELEVSNQLPPGITRIFCRQGKFEKRVDFPYGHHHNPIKAEDVVDKFRDCLAFSPRPISNEDRERVIDMILNLEKVNDIREIIRLLA